MDVPVSVELMVEVVSLVLVYMSAWFVVSLLITRADVADVAWGPGFVLIGSWLALRPDAPGSLRQYVVVALVTVWAARLAWHVARRNFRPGRTEDSRYANWRREWGAWFVPRSYLQVFVLQGIFMLFIAAPVIVSGASAGSSFALIEAAGVCVWLAGFVFEALGDAQLARFLAKPENAGHIMDRGLWAWTRHPNYFGEATMWWGLAIMCLGIPGGWIAFVGPVTITWSLLKVSGIPLLEAARAGQPEWEAYKARTSAFVPLPPKR